MSDTKISALTASTTPLAGTEVVPLVQSGSTKNVSVANLTAGRAVSALSITSATIGSSSGSLSLQSSGATNATLDSSGNFGIGTSSLATKLVVNGNQALIGGGNPTIPTLSTSLSLNEITSNSAASLASDYGFLRLSAGGGTSVGYKAAIDLQGYGATDNSQIRFYTAGVQRAVIDPSGNLTLNTGNLVQGTAAKGINFTANTPAAGKTSQLLNWYEEGTFNATLSTTGTDFASVTYSSQSCRYVRIGTMVWIQGRVTTTAVDLTGSNSQVVIASLPFTAASSSAGSNGRGSLIVNYTAGWGLNAPNHGWVEQGTTRIRFYTRALANGNSVALNAGVGADVSATSNDIMFSAMYVCA